jgi:nicotinamide mononucleotide transporter
VTSLEITATLLGLANIILIVRRSVWNYPFALAMVALYFFIFRDAKLYSDAGLQVFFFLVNLYGWWAWSRNADADGAVSVERLSLSALVLWIAGTLLATLIWGAFMARFTDASLPLWDAGVAMVSVAAQLLMVRRRIENWYWWITVNAVSIPLYLTKGLLLTAGLYALFLALAVWGLIEWRRSMATTGDIVRI